MTGTELNPTVTFQAGAAVGKHRFVKLTTSTAAILQARVIQAAAAGDDAVGISCEEVTAAEVTAGQLAIACVLPGCKTWLMSGAAIDTSAGVVPLTSDATGRGVAVAAAGDRVLAYAMESAAAADVRIQVLFLKGGSHRDA